MAGQPPEPSFQPTGQDQDHGLTQGRPSWQPSYTPPPATPASGSVGGGQQAYAAPPPYGAPDQGYGAQEQTYVGQPGQVYGAPDPAYAPAGLGQGYPGYQGYGTPPGQEQGQGQAAGYPPPQWHASAGTTPAAQPKQRGDKGFIGSLFDFSFSLAGHPEDHQGRFTCSPCCGRPLCVLAYVIVGFSFGGFWGGIGVLILAGPVMMLFGVGVSRVVLEAFMVFFRIHDELKEIRKQGEGRS